MQVRTLNTLLTHAHQQNRRMWPTLKKRAPLCCLPLCRMAQLTNSSAQDTLTFQPYVFTLFDLDDEQVTIPRLAITSIFLVIFLILLMLTIVFLVVSAWKRQVLKRNQKWMIGLLATILVFQTIALSSRLIITSLYFDSDKRLVDYTLTQISQSNVTESERSHLLDQVNLYRNITTTTDEAGIPFPNLIVIFLFTSIDIFFTLSNLFITMITMCFISNMFVKTVQLTKGALASDHSKKLIKAFNVITGIFSVFFFAAVLTIVWCLFFINMHVLEDFQMELYLACFVLYLLQMLSQIIVSTVSLTSLLHF